MVTMFVCMCVGVTGVRDGKRLSKTQNLHSHHKWQMQHKWVSCTWERCQKPGHTLFYLMAMWALSFASMHMLFMIVFLYFSILQSCHQTPSSTSSLVYAWSQIIHSIFQDQLAISRIHHQLTWSEILFQFQNPREGIQVPLFLCLS